MPLISPHEVAEEEVSSSHPNSSFELTSLMTGSLSLRSSFESERKAPFKCMWLSKGSI